MQVEFALAMAQQDHGRELTGPRLVGQPMMDHIGLS